MAIAATPRINKSKVVRQILEEIGALNETPPDSWRSTVEEKLSKHKDKDGKAMKMNAVTIYQLRRVEIDKMAGKRKTRTTKFNDLAKLVEVKKFAETVGGIDQLEQAIAFLKQLA